MYQPAKFSNGNKRMQRLTRLESEHQRNQNRIRELHRRNRELEDEIRHLSSRRLSPKPPKRPLTQPLASKVTKSKSLRRILRDGLAPLAAVQLGEYSLLFWLQVASLVVGVALICGIAGFLLMRLLASLI